MESKIIHVPNTLKDDGAITFINDLNNYINYKSVAIDFSLLKWVAPFGTLVVAESFKNFVEVRQKNDLKTYYVNHEYLMNKNSGAISYLKYFGFFDYCGLPLGNTCNRQYHTNNYIPIQIIEQNELEKGISFGNWRKKIEKKCKEISLLITKNDFESNYLEYAFREIIRNVFEHSGTNTCSIMAQCYRSGEIEIAVADRGSGIFNSLKNKYNIDSPINALELCVEPGVSKEDIENTKGDWGNTGFGLYILSGIGMEYGEFSIISNGAYLKKHEGDKKTVINNNIFYNGTVVKIIVNKDELVYFPNLLKKLIDEGEEIYFQKHGKKLKASGKSRSSSLIIK